MRMIILDTKKVGLVCKIFYQQGDGGFIQDKDDNTLYKSDNFRFLIESSAPV